MRVVKVPLRSDAIYNFYSTNAHFTLTMGFTDDTGNTRIVS